MKISLSSLNAIPSPDVNFFCLQLDPWKLEADDTKLLDLMPFLEAVVRTQVPDVRQVVASYEGQDIPIAFKCGYLPSSSVLTPAPMCSHSNVSCTRRKPDRSPSNKAGAR